MSIELILSAGVKAGTCLLFATLGEILSERVGHLNLGVEGMMQIGAVIGFMAGLYSGSPLLALGAAALSAALGALIYALLTVTFKTNQIVTGLALTIFGTGFATFFGDQYIGEKVPETITSAFVPYAIPGLSQIPVIGDALFNQSPYVYFSYIAVVVCAIYLYKTKWGLNTQMIGENPMAADASGIPIDLYKYINITIGGALAGLGGAFLSLVYLTTYQGDVVLGRGWIAVALVIFVTWNPVRAIVGAYFFGILATIGFRIQQYDWSPSIYLLDALPYIVTVVVLVIMSIRKSKDNQAPAWLGNDYFRENR
jgi:simple sugar transport system permease protein